MEPKLYRYKDPRTGEDEYASPDDIDAVKRYLMAWKFYWDGPIGEDTDTGEEVSMYTREEWLVNERRYQWFDTLTDDQKQTLTDSAPPEEVSTLESVDD